MSKPVTYLAWGLETVKDGRRRLDAYDGKRPDIIEARAHARQFLAQDKASGRLPKSARVVRIRVRIEVA